MVVRPRIRGEEGHTMPTIAPAVVSWVSLSSDEPIPGIVRRRIVGERAMIARIELAGGAFVPTHAHENEQLAIIVSGALRFGLGADGSPERRVVTAQAGEVMVLPSRACSANS